MRRLSSDWHAKLADDHTIDLGVLGSVSASALTADLPIGTRPDGLPTTFVPGRNLVFLTFAAIVAEQRGLKHVIAGMCETDYSGYPDCRDDTIKSLQATLNLGMASRIVLHTPLMWRTKAATWELAQELAGRQLIDLILEESHSCYLGERTTRHDWGYGCGSCDACRLRQKGWSEFTHSRPTLR
jgi:7-cyano-7-deazaguanine synthase